MLKIQRHTLAAWLLLLCFAATMLASCENSAVGDGKSPVFLVFGSDDIWGKTVDVYSPGVSGGVTDEVFEATITSIYKNQTDTPTTVFADVLIQEYRVTYYRADGNPNVPEPFVNQLQAPLPAGGEITLNIMLLRKGAKLKSPLKELAFGGGEGEIHMQAALEFFGEDLAGNAVSTKGVVTVWASDYPG